MPRSSLLVALLAALTACSGGAGSRTAAAPPHAERARVHAVLSVGKDVATTLPRSGTLIAYWMTKAEYDSVMSGSRDLTPLARLLDRLVVIGPADLSHGTAEMAIDVEPGDIVVSAVLDTQHDGIGSILGGARSPDGDLMGDSKPVHVTSGTAEGAIVLDQVAHQEHGPEACAGENRELVTLEAPEVAGTMGNDTKRRLCVILPASYAASPGKRYPVVYEFPGWGGDDAHYLTMFHHDELFRAAAPDAILVLIDTSTKSGSSYLVDSPRTGAWDTYVTKRVIPAIDAKFRTIAKREGRATAGLSTGGFGALSYGLRHPELIGVVSASAPDGPDITSWLFGDGVTLPPWTPAMLAVETATGGEGFFASYGSDWSPDQSPRGWASPLDPSTGKLVPEVVAKWRAQGPSVWLDDPARAAAIKTAFDGKLCLSVGKRDEFALHPALLAFAGKLTKLAIRHELLLSEGGHIDPDVMTKAYRCAAQHLSGS
jgi:hypothetical protein